MANELSDHDILIKIITALEKGGIEEAQKAAQELKEKMKDASGGSDMLSKAMEVLGGKGKAAGDTLRGLYGLMTKDGPSAVQSLGKSIQGLGNLFGAALGPTGAIASIAMVGYEVVKGIMDAHAQAAEEAAKKAAEEAEKAAQAFEERIAGAADAAREHVKGLAEEFMATAKATEDAVKATQELKDAQLELATARIDAQMFQREGESAEDFAARKKDLEQQKINLKASNDEDKIQSQIEQLQAQIDALDKTDKAAEEAAGKAHAAWLNHDAIQVGALEQAWQANQMTPWQTMPQTPDQLKKVADEAVKASEEAYAQESELKAKDDAARQAWQETLAENAKKREDLQAQIAALEVKNQTIAVKVQTDIAKSQQDYEKSLPKPKPEETEKEKAEREKKEATARQQAFIDHPGHLAAAQGLVRNAVDAGLGNGTITLGGAVGERAQAQGRAAIAEAGARIQAGENNQQVIDDLCATLDKLGSVITNMSALKKHLDALDGKLDLVSSQVRSSRS